MLSEFLDVDVVVNFLSHFTGNFYFSFVSTSLAHIIYQKLKTKEKQKLPVK